MISNPDTGTVALLDRYIERPPEWFRCLVPGGLFRMPPSADGPSVWLTFDDGPVPEVTPQVLDILDRYGVKATFFMVGENAARYPGLVAEVRERGHRIGNHTYHHLRGFRVPTSSYMEDVACAAEYIDSDLFRPPHGWLRPTQLRALKSGYRMVMYDVVTRDYSRRLTAEDVIANVRRWTRDGSIIVFHDSVKSLERLREALPASLEWLIGEGYKFKTF